MGFMMHSPLFYTISRAMAGGRPIPARMYIRGRLDSKVHSLTTRYSDLILVLSHAVILVQGEVDSVRI